MKLSSFPTAREHSLVVVIITLLAIIAFAGEYFIGESVTQLLVYQRQLISQGEVWRIFTGHLLHTNGFHLLLNLAAFILLWALHGRFYSIKNMSALLLFCAASTSLGIYYYQPSLIQYVGLSGILHGAFVFGAVMDIIAKDKTGYLLLIGVWLKIAYEQLYGASTEVSELIEASVAVDAHLWGAIGGLLFTVFFIVMPNNKVKKTSDRSD